METKHNSKCLEKAKDDEPIFVLRAQDALAPQAVRVWANLAKENGLPKAKYQEAMDVARAMEKWPDRKMPD